MTESEHDLWLKQNKLFVSKPIKKLFIGSWGFYILTAYKKNIFPKFYFMKTKYFIECGFSFAGFIFEIQNNKIEKIQKS